jgi:hypothetical protein
MKLVILLRCKRLSFAEIRQSQNGIIHNARACSHGLKCLNSLYYSPRLERVTTRLITKEMKPSALTFTSLVVVIISIVVYQQVYKKHWYVVKGLDRSTFNENHANFNPINIPTTFYQHGRLNKTMKKASRSFSYVFFFPYSYYLTSLSSNNSWWILCQYFSSSGSMNFIFSDCIPTNKILMSM